MDLTIDHPEDFTGTNFLIENRPRVEQGAPKTSGFVTEVGSSTHLDVADISPKLYELGGILLPEYTAYLSPLPPGTPVCVIHARAGESRFYFDQGTTTETDVSLRETVDSLIDGRLSSIVTAAQYESFEDGMESVFSMRLRVLIFSYGIKALERFLRLVENDTVAAEVVSEGLRLIGRIRNQTTRSYRLWLLAKFLEHRDPIVRDGAALGLVELGDSEGAKYIRAAIKRETNPMLKDDLELALGELEAF